MASNLTKKTNDPAVPTDKAKKLLKLVELHNKVKADIAELRDELLAETKRLDVLTLKTGDYIIMRQSRTTVRVEDKKSLEQDLVERDIPVVTAIDMDYMRPIVSKLIAEGETPDGVSINKTEYITIKKNKGKK